MSPFRRLPVDIIYHIVMIADYNQRNTLTELKARSVSHIPTLLTQVSRPLHEIVLRVPNLWTQIDVRWRWSSFATDPRRLFEKVKRFAALSGVLPLSIHLDEWDFQHPGKQHVQKMQPVPYLLRQILSSDFVDNRRLAKLSLTSPKHDEMKNLVTGLILSEDNILPNLVSLMFGPAAYDRGSCSSGQFFTNILEKLPSLRKFSSGEMALVLDDLFDLDPQSSTSMLQHWHKLTALHIRCNIARDDWLILLQSCPNLEFGWFAMAETAEEYVVDVPPADISFTHHDLRELCLLFEDRTQHLFVFSGLQFPHLITLRLQFIEADLQSPGARHSVAARHIEKAFPSLQHLVLVNTMEAYPDIEYIFPLFLAVPTTLTLSISLSYDAAVDLLEFLQEGHDGQFILPNLQLLRLAFSPLEASFWSNSIRPAEDPLETAIVEIHLTRNSVLSSTRSFHTKIDFIGQGSERINQGPLHEKMRQYFQALQKRFQQENIGIPVRTREVFVLDCEDYYFSGDLMYHFDP